MTGSEMRQSFLEFFKKRGHAVVPSSSLIPDDPSVLLTTAGMQQFKKYYTGELDVMKDFGSKNTVTVQKCFRTSDIDEVGDESHLTFFEMLGNFSFGGYFKKQAIEYAYEFITKIMGLKIDYVTVFDPAKVPTDDWRKGVECDDESRKIWEGLRVKDIRSEGVDVFWGPTGNEGPCGPTTEIFVNGLEIWNLVFNEFYCDTNKNLTPLKTKGVDTGMGFERLVVMVQNKKNIYETDLFSKMLALMPKSVEPRTQRIVVDHARSVAFLLADGIRPSNKGAGYVLRRLMRRLVFYEREAGQMEHYFKTCVEQYHASYPELSYETIAKEFGAEREKFDRTLSLGIKELKRIDFIDAETAFKLYESFGLPYEVMKELGGQKAAQLHRDDFDKEFERHQEISRAGVEKKFGGHGLTLNTGELKAGSDEETKKVIRLHTASHLLQQALRDVLGDSVQQRGSDITPERARFDFLFERKLTPEELKKVEAIVNEKIKEDLPVSYKEMPKSEAEKTGALYFFKGKYPETVKVYFVGPSLEKSYSKEFCGGPHVAHTGEIGRFKILKEESSSTGVRRIRATVL